MAIAEINPDVPSTAQTPNTYFFISTAPTTTATNQPKDLFIVATGILSGSQITNAPYSLTAGDATPNEIKQYSSVKLVNQRFNRKSPVANRFRNAIQEVPIGINIFLAALSEPSNSGFAGMATKLLRFSGTASGSGEIRLRVAGHLCRIPVADGDTGTEIAAAAKTVIDAQLLDAPMVTAAVIDHQLPIITIATNATGSNFTIVADGITKIITIGAGATPTVAAAAIAAALSGDANFPLTATSALGVVNATWRAGFPVATVTISGADITQTYALTYGASGATTGATVPLIYVVRGADGNDCASFVDIPPEITGLSVSPASITVSTAAAGKSGAASTFQLKVGASTNYVTSIPVATSAVDAATLIAATINSQTGPLSASAQGATVNLFHRSGWYVSRIQVASNEDVGGQTYRLYDRHDSAGVISSVTTVAGTSTFTGLQGAGSPSLTALLENRAKMSAFSEWTVDYQDTTSTSAIYAHIEQYGNGYYNEGQRATWLSTASLEDAAAIAPAAVPALGNSWRYSVGVYQDAPCPGGSYSTQVAARLCATDLPFNLSGYILTSGTIAPLLPARAETELTPLDVDVALGSYHLYVLKSNRGAVQIVRGKTTWTADNTEWGDWSFGRTFDNVRYGMRAFLNNRFQGRVLFVGGGTVRVSNGVTPIDIKDAIGEYLDTIDGVLVDNAKALKQYIEVEPAADNPGFVRVYFRVAPPRELQIISGVIASAPSALAA